MKYEKTNIWGWILGTGKRVWRQSVKKMRVYIYFFLFALMSAWYRECLLVM